MGPSYQGPCPSKLLGGSFMPIPGNASNKGKRQMLCMCQARLRLCANNKWFPRHVLLQCFQVLCAECLMLQREKRVPVNAHYECMAYQVAQYEWLDTSLSFDQPLHLKPIMPALQTMPFCGKS